MRRLLNKTTPDIVFLQETLTYDERTRDVIFSLKPG